MRTSEGCYWGRCTFCARYGPQKVDWLSPGAAVDTMDGLREIYGIKDFSVNDDCMPPEYWEELCTEILRRRLRISMLVWAKPVAGFTRRRLELMAKAGVKQVRWGVESAHPRILRLMGKGTTINTARRVLLDADEVGIWNHACFILGFPTETRDEATATLDFIRSHRKAIHSFILYPFVLYEHSAIFRNPKEFGIRDLIVSETPFFDAVSYVTEKGMNKMEVRRLVTKFKADLISEDYNNPFWYYLKFREYLHLYLDRYGLRDTLKVPFRREGLRGTWEGWED